MFSHLEKEAYAPKKVYFIQYSLEERLNSLGFNWSRINEEDYLKQHLSFNDYAEYLRLNYITSSISGFDTDEYEARFCTSAVKYMDDSKYFDKESADLIKKIIENKIIIQNASLDGDDEIRQYNFRLISDRVFVMTVADSFLEDLNSSDHFIKNFFVDYVKDLIKHIDISRISKNNTLFNLFLNSIRA